VPSTHSELSRRQKGYSSLIVGSDPQGAGDRESSRREGAPPATKEGAVASYPASAQALFDIHGKAMPLKRMSAREMIHATAQSRHDAPETARQPRDHGFLVEITGPDGKSVDEKAP
jgi:hypothetical protein